MLKVDTSTGNWSMVGKFEWPAEIFGCVIEYDPSVTFDHQSGKLFLDYTEDFGLLVTLDVQNARVEHVTKPTDPFFTGFENMVYAPKFLANRILGLSATVEESGYCDDGCFQFGQLELAKGDYKNISDVPFKEMADDTHYYDTSADVLWVQGGYDLRETKCGPHDYSLCLLQIDAKTGALKSAVYTNYTVYKYQYTHASGSTVLAFAQSVKDCPDEPDNEGYLFGTVDLSTAELHVAACLQKVVIHEAEWISSFSADGLLWAQASGNAEAGSAQLDIFDTSNGRARVNTALDGVGGALGAYMGLFDVWAVTWI